MRDGHRRAAGGSRGRPPRPSSEAPGPPRGRILVCAVTNVAVDNVLHRLLHEGYEDLVRIGSARRIAKEIQPYVVSAEPGLAVAGAPPCPSTAKPRCGRCGVMALASSGKSGLGPAGAAGPGPGTRTARPSGMRWGGGGGGGGIRWGVSPAAQMGCLRNRSGSPPGADQP